MDAFRQCINRCRTVVWLLVITFLEQTFIPLRFHLHHDDIRTAHVHEHKVDFHLYVDYQDDHHKDENTHELKTTPDIINKQNTAINLVFALFFCLLSLLLTNISVLNRHWLTIRKFFFRSFYFGLSPPSRAPPAYR